MTPTLPLALALLIGGLCVLVLELFIPSAGILFLIATACILASVLVSFQVSSSAGLTMTGVVVLLALVLPWIGFEAWKRSPIGRRMMLGAPRSEEDQEDDNHGEMGLSLVGAVGKTLTPHRPSGATLINGNRVDTVSQGIMIERDRPVRVIEVQGNRVVVSEIPEDEHRPSLDDPDFEF
jgi:membrane-bound ClpP family serine protease